MVKRRVAKNQLLKRKSSSSTPIKKTKAQTRWQAFKYSFTTTLIFFLTALGLWAILLMLEYFIGFDLFHWFSELPFIYPIAAYIATQIKRKTFEGIIYAFSLSSLFIIPSPLEILFIGFLSSVRSTTGVIIPAFIGLIIGQHLNFFSGRMFGRISKKYIDKSTREKVAKRLQEYGAIAIFFINLLPLPYPITNFLAGSLKYPYKKWVLFTSLGLAIKLVFIAWLYSVIF